MVKNETQAIDINFEDLNKIITNSLPYVYLTEFHDVIVLRIIIRFSLTYISCVEFINSLRPIKSTGSDELSPKIIKLNEKKTQAVSYFAFKIVSQ